MHVCKFRTGSLENEGEVLWRAEKGRGATKRRAFRGTSLARNFNPPRNSIGLDAYAYCRVHGGSIL